VRQGLAARGAREADAALDTGWSGELPPFAAGEEDRHDENEVEAHRLTPDETTMGKDPRPIGSGRMESRLPSMAGSRSSRSKASLVQEHPMPSNRQSLFALAALSCACDSQAGGGYLGEPLASFPGYVSSAGDGRLEAAMLWQRGAPPSTNDQELATRAPVQTGFPARFMLHLYQPPPAAARRTLAPGQVPYARANAGAVPYGVAASFNGTAPAAGSGPFGIDANHWIVYLPSDVPPGSLMEWWLGEALPAGFHLLRVTKVYGECMSAAQLDACAADLAGRGVPDDGTADPGTGRSFCRASYRLSVPPRDEQLVLDLAPPGPSPGPGCPG
jgi:hypothetical protein